MTDTVGAIHTHPSPDEIPTANKPPRNASPLGQAWRDLRSKPMFWVAAAIILLMIVMSIAPGLFTETDPRRAVLARSFETPNGNAWFGRDYQGYDLYARCIYGARASIMVGVLTALGTAILGSILGLVAGYLGGIVDTLLSRFAEIFFALPLLLGSIVFLATVGQGFNSFFAKVLLISLCLTLLGWPSIFRLMRSSVLQVKPNEYVLAARALGASPLRIIFKHVLSNAMGPVIVVSTINLGVFISVEASLSFLGIGLQNPIVSWGQMISEGSRFARVTPHVLLFPAAFLSLTVLGFIMLGDTVRDAFDPKSQ